MRATSPALFALLEGRIEARQGGRRRSSAIVGERMPGHLFGEVPIALGSKFPVSFRAVGAARVMRLEARDYHEIAARSPDDHAQRSGELAHVRIEGRAASRTSRPSNPQPRAHRRRRQAGCRRARRCGGSSTATRSRSAGSSRTTETRRSCGADRFPTRATARRFACVEREDRRAPARCAASRSSSSSRREPDARGVRRRRRGRRGPSGLAAGVYGASEGLSTLVIEREAPGGQAGTSSRIENYLGFPSGVSGDDLARRALRPGPPPRRRDPRHPLDRAASTQRRSASTSTTGTSSRRGRSSSPAASRGGDSRSTASTASPAKVLLRASRSDARNVHGHDVHIVGAGNSAGQAALHFANHARKVTILCRRCEHRRRACRSTSSTRSRGNDRTSTFAPSCEVALCARRDGARGDRHSNVGRRTRSACRPTVSTSSSARTPRPAGSRPRSRSTNAATCSPGRT